MPTHCAVLQDRVALLATTTYRGDEIYTSSPDLHWNKFEVPYDHMSLTIYQSKFVLVGGYNPYTREVMNTVFTSTTGQQWEPSLPPMPTKRYATSSVSTTSPEALVVAGGIGSNSEDLNIVEVLMGENWLTTDYLPTPDRNMSSTVHEGNLYFMTRSPFPNTIMTCSCTSLISSCTDSSRTTSTDSPLWRQFEAPYGHWSIISYSSQLVIIDRWGTTRSYSSTTQSWVQASIAGDGPHKSHEDNVNNSIATVLPTGKILYCYRGGVYRGTISSKIILCILIYVAVMCASIVHLHIYIVRLCMHCAVSVYCTCVHILYMYACIVLTTCVLCMCACIMHMCICCPCKHVSYIYTCIVHHICR